MAENFQGKVIITQEIESIVQKARESAAGINPSTLKRVIEGINTLDDEELKALRKQDKLATLQNALSSAIISIDESQSVEDKQLVAEYKGIAQQLLRKITNIQQST